MTSLEMDSFIAVPLPTALVGELLKRSPFGISSLLETVVTNYLERTEVDFLPSLEPTGVMWESVFLPNGTQVRTKYYGEFKVAAIEGDAIVWEGEVYSSFAQLANAMRGGTMNNAWKELHIKRPTDRTWLLARSIRR